MKRLLNFIIGKLFKIPLVNLDNCYPPVNYEKTSLDVETLSCDILTERGLLVPEIILKRELASRLAYELIPYIDFKTTEDIYTDSIRYRGVIRIVKERQHEQA